MKNYAVGIDLGGTNIKGGLVRADGSVQVRKSIKTEVDGGLDHVVARIAGLAEELMVESVWAGITCRSRTCWPES